MPAVKLHEGLVPALVGNMDDPDRLRAHRIADAIQARYYDEPAWDPLPPERYPKDRNVLRFPGGRALEADREAVEFGVEIGDYIRWPRSA